MNDPPLGDSGSGLVTARTFRDVHLCPTGFTVDLPEEIPGLARDEGIPHGHSPVSKALEAVLRGVLDGVGQRHADLTAGGVKVMLSPSQ